MLAWIADLTWARPKAVLAVVGLLLVLAAVFARNIEDHLKAAGFTDSSSESEQATSLLRESLGYDPNPGIVLVVRDPEGGRLDLTSSAIRAEINRLSTAVDGAEHVARVINPLDDPDGRTSSLVAEDGRSVVITAHLSTQDVEDEGGAAAEDVSERIAGSSLDVVMGGFAPSFNEVNDQTREDLTKAELIAFPALAFLLLLVFRSLIAAAIPLVIGVLSIAATFLILRLMSELVDTSLFALNIATGLSLGLAVDYALLLVSRYREEIGRQGPTREAHRVTVLRAGRAVLFSGATVAAALVALVLLPQRFLYSLGVAGAAVGLVSALVALLVVPSILSIAGARINSLAIRRGPSVSAESGGWYRLARGVMGRPVAVALGSSALLLLVSAPLLITTLTGPSAEAVPPGQRSYDANEYVEAHYPRDVTEAVTVTVRGHVDREHLRELDRTIAGVPGVSRAAPIAPASPNVAYTNLALDGPALNSDSQDTVREIRAIDPGPGAELLVSGNTARFIDQKQSLAEHAPLVIAIVAASMFVLLFLLTGSFLLPLKTLVMNALTLAATLGILVAAFQEGWLAGPLDYSGPGAIEVTSLVFLFAVIFGLATDYAVLVMARIKEAYDGGAVNEEAVATGIARTGRVITAAAGMIATVFLAFAVSPVFFMKQIAIGMAVGVLLDATVVRALLVPSLMRLFGAWNWWAPGPLRSLHRRFALGA